MERRTWCRFQPSAQLRPLSWKTSSWCSTSCTGTTAGQRRMSALFMSQQFLTAQSLTNALHACRFAEDYKVALQRSYAWTNQVPPDVPDAQGFLVRPRPRHRQNARVKTEVLTLSFWCLNPAVVRYSECKAQLSSTVGLLRHVVLTMFELLRLSLTWAAQCTASCWHQERCHPWAPSPLNWGWNFPSSLKPTMSSTNPRFITSKYDWFDKEEQLDFNFLNIFMKTCKIMTTKTHVIGFYFLFFFGSSTFVLRVSLSNHETAETFRLEHWIW